MLGAERVLNLIHSCIHSSNMNLLRPTLCYVQCSSLGDHHEPDSLQLGKMLRMGVGEDGHR